MSPCRLRSPAEYREDLLENVHPFLDLLVALGLKVLIIAGRVPRIERMISYNVHGLLRQRRLVVFQHTVHVLVVSPRHHQLLDSATRLVNAIQCVVSRIVGVGIALETVVAIDNVIAPATAHGECVADHSPLRLIVERHYFAQIMDQCGQVEPVQLRVFGASPLSR